MKIIDYARKGNVIRFYLGDNDCNDYYGDDWNDTPYSLNAGPVYDEFIKGHFDIYVPFDNSVLTPENINCCMNDVKDRKYPCVMIINSSDSVDWRSFSFGEDEFYRFLNKDDVIKIYLNDDEKVLKEVQKKLS